MQSFLEEINDNNLHWTTDDDDHYDDSFSSSSDFSSSSSEQEEEIGDDHNDMIVNMAPMMDDLGQNDDARPVVEGVEDSDTATSQNNIEQQQQQQQQQQPQQQQGNEIQNTNQNQYPVVIQQLQQPPIINAPVAQSIQNEMFRVSGPSRAIHNNLRNHPLANSMLFRVSLCEEQPLIRAEIDWKLLQKQIPTYPAVLLGDELGAHLLQSVLRTDPPCEIIRDIIKHYPKSCVNMDSYYAACQYASDEAVQLLMKRTMKARKIEGITWSMLAFLGDARVRIRHARFLLQCVPEALVDPMHGVFGVSPLDRMMSGAFIHGSYREWVEKLKLALFTAENGSLNGWGSKTFFPFHILMQRLVSHDFMGVRFDPLSFVHGLTACVESETNSEPPFHQVDEKGNLPLHIALQQVCDTNLGVTGERKLIKFLLHANPDSAMARDENGKLPIVLAIENGWPVYDIIAKACPLEYTEGERDDGNNNIGANLLLHDVLSCKYHPRFGVSGARLLIKYILKTYPSSIKNRNHDGRFPLHIGVENGWPCHDILVAAYPSAIDVQDPVTKFYPFQLACNAQSQVSEKKGLTELSTLYELINWNPLLLKNIVSDNMEKGLKRKLGSESDEAVCICAPESKKKCS